MAAILPQLVAANDASYAGPAHGEVDACNEARSASASPQQRVSRHGSPSGHGVSATIDDIRYAQELRLQIRSRYLARVVPSVALWCVGVD
jgi:hypothetical protein